jgi:hypothetical protein
MLQSSNTHTYIYIYIYIYLNANIWYINQNIKNQNRRSNFKNFQNQSYICLRNRDCESIITNIIQIYLYVCMVGRGGFGGTEDGLGLPQILKKKKKKKNKKGIKKIYLKAFGHAQKLKILI